MYTYEEIRQQMYEAPISGELMREAEKKGREETYATMLEAKFGPDERIAAVATALAALPHAEAARALLAAASLEDLPGE